MFEVIGVIAVCATIFVVVAGVAVYALAHAMAN